MQQQTSCQQRPHLRTGSARIAILEAARSLLGTVDDFGRVTLEDIAREAHVARTSVHYHFGRRDDVLLALLDHLDGSSGVEVELQHALDHPSASSLTAALRALTRSQFESHAVTLALDRLHGGESESREAFRRRREGRRQILNQLLRRLEGAGLLAPGLRAPDAADMLWACAEAAVHDHLARTCGVRPEETEEWLLRLAHSCLQEP